MIAIDRQLWLIVPVKPLGEAKSRLHTALDAVQRAHLSRVLLEKTLATVRMVHFLAGVIVVSRDRDVLDRTREIGMVPLAETERSLNQALEQARDEAIRRGAGAVLVLPSDLPLLTADDLQTLYVAGRTRSNVVIAPSRDGGTNALLLQPPACIKFCFGIGSFSAHRAAAARAGLHCSVIRSPTLAFDVDSPHDLALLSATGLWTTPAKQGLQQARSSIS